MNLTYLPMAIAALSICACSDDNRQNIRAKTANRYRMLGDVELRKTLIWKNVRDAHAGAYLGDDGVDIYPKGYALVLVEGSFKASYTIKDSKFCLKTFNIPQCSYFITNGRHIFRVSVNNHRAVSLVDICPIRYPGDVGTTCKGHYRLQEKH